MAPQGKTLPNTNGKQNKILESQYERQPPQLEGEPSDMIRQENGSVSLEMENRIIIEQDNEDASEMVPSFIVELAYILM